MDPRTFPRMLRIEGLIPFTGCAILIGFAVTLQETGPAAADWTLFAVAAIAAILIHVDGHIWNDILDLDIDRHEKSRETGRDRPLVLGWATVSEYRTASLIITSVILILAIWLSLFRIFIPLFVILGFAFDYGYNHPRFALAHHPGTEWYLFPWLVVGVSLTVVYAATGVISLLAGIVSLLYGLIATSFVVSMMRRDFRSDRIGGKITSSVLNPDLPHATRYGIVAMIVPVPAAAFLAAIPGYERLAYLLLPATVICAGIITYFGAQIDQLSTRALYTDFPSFEGDASRLVQHQARVSVIYAVAISVMVALYGRVL